MLGVEYEKNLSNIIILIQYNTIYYLAVYMQIEYMILLANVNITSIHLEIQLGLVVM